MFVSNTRMNTMLNQLYRYRKFIFSFLIILGIFFYTLWSTLATKDYVVIPQMFSDAKAEGDVYTNDFISLAQKVQDSLVSIKNLYDKGENEEMLAQIRDQNARIDELKSKGTELLGSLTQMTYGLGGILPELARSTAYEAITYRIQMIDDLVSYSNNLKEIFKFLIDGNTNQSVLQEKIDIANKNAKNINDLNAKFNEAINKLENF